LTACQTEGRFVMTRKQIESVIAEGVPFTVRLADGRSYVVPHRDYISLPPKDITAAVVWEDDGTAHILPMRTMTGLSYNTRSKSSRSRR